MRQTIKSIWVLIFLLLFSNKLSASDFMKNDSLKVAEIVNEFYEWYITAIKEKNYSEFGPKFIENKNGMTTLEFSTYLKNLKTKAFSDSLILKEKQSYQVCIRNLEKVKYSDFQKTSFTDLDEFEQAHCDFGNYYRWIGGQEPIDGIRIKKTTFQSTDLVIVKIDYFEYSKEKNEKYFWGENRLTLKKLRNHWFIYRIDSWKNID
ncbi:hypothetical protein [Saccharicrinis sp. FJH54]|uniref:hypothetical protein n=1 Tax=Saccharicrinis sp. FJH54 TaxID=3344665 RepID=UPI0035D4635F